MGSWIVCFAFVALSAEPPQPCPTLNPPADIAPAQTRSVHYRSALQVPPRVFTAEERARYEANVEWFHKAKYGVMYHFLAGIAEHRSSTQWTAEKWNAWVDAVDVEHAAEQAKEVGAGYVILTIGQNCRYYCAPNPILEKHWNLKPDKYGSRRDLPADLQKALEKRGIRLMLYIATDHQYKLPRPAALNGQARFDRWLEVMEWYSDHYGAACSGWWIDGLYASVGGKDYTAKVHAALRHGNPDALIASGTYGLSDFTHGHAHQKGWNEQRRRMLPYYGRWDAEYGIQWQVLQYLGSTWASPTLGHRTDELVEYAERVVQGGGVITFDVGTLGNVDGQPGPRLEIPAGQLEQLRAVRDALRLIPASNGSAKL